MVVNEPLDVRDEVTHQVLHGWTRPVVLSLGFSGDTLREFLHTTDLQEELSVPLTEGQFLLVRLAFNKYPGFYLFIYFILYLKKNKRLKKNKKKTNVFKILILKSTSPSL